MAEKRSKKFFIATRTSVRAMCRLIPAIRRLFTRPCGNRVKDRGKTECSTETAAVCLNPPPAAKGAAINQKPTGQHRAGEHRDCAERAENIIRSSADKNDRETLSLGRRRRK